MMLGTALKFIGTTVLILAIVIALIVGGVRGCGGNDPVSIEKRKTLEAIAAHNAAVAKPSTTLLPEYPVNNKDQTEVRIPYNKLFIYKVSVTMYMWVNDDTDPIKAEPGKEPHLGNNVMRVRFKCIDRPNGTVYFIER